MRLRNPDILPKMIA
jgi:hypothetical protein